ncbi:MAG: adenosine kinase [Bacteroidales bacterium]
MKKILGMGNALVDVLIHLKDDTLLDRLRLPKGSMQLVDEKRVTEIMQAVEGLPVTMVAGGSAANTIHGLANLGMDTGFIGSAGEDQWGEFYVNNLKESKIEPIFYRSPKPTGRANALLTPDSERTFGTFLGAATDLSPEFLSPEMFMGYSLFYIEGYMVQNHDLIRRALHLAKAEGCLVSLDLASYNVVEENRGFLHSVIPGYVDFIFANEEEGRAFTGLKPEQAVAELASLCPVAVVKTGSHGALAQRGQEVTSAPALPVKAIDTTGAGDLFASGFLFAYLNGLPLTQCLEIGNLLASKVISVTGSKVPAEQWSGILEAIQSKKA